MVKRLETGKRNCCAVRGMCDPCTIQYTEAATKVLGKKVPKAKPWFNRICEEAVQRRKLARQEWLIDTSDEVTLRRFRTRQREACKILRCEKRKYIQNRVEMAELD
ncbi:hypothetical protein QTP88_004951 [Uroleucon formosanum]